MSDDLSHLGPGAAELLQAPHDQRIRAILGERWVQYARAGQVLRILNLLLEHPRTTRMPSIAVYGDSGMGKTMIMHRFRAEHPPLFDGQAGVERTRVLALQLAGKPGERRLYAQILSALGVPQNPRAGVVELEQAAIRLMRAMDVQVLLLDEVHNILSVAPFGNSASSSTRCAISAMNCRSRWSVSASTTPGKQSAAMCNWPAASRSFR